MQRLVHYAYNFDYDDAPTTYSAYSNALETNAVVYSLTDRSKCADLAAHAIKKFRHAAGFASHLTVPPLNAISMVYTTTPQTDRGLRNICVKLWSDMEGQLRASSDEEDVYSHFGDFERGDIRRDTCLLAHANWETVLNIFRSTKTKEYDVVLQIIRGEYREATPHHEICDLEDTAVTSVAVMLHGVITELCPTWMDGEETSKIS